MKKLLLIIVVIGLFITSASAKEYGSIIHLEKVNNDVSDTCYYNETVHGKFPIEYVNFSFKFDRKSIEEYLKHVDEKRRVEQDLIGDSMTIDAILSSSSGAWPFYETSDIDRNCYGYASQFNTFRDPGDIALVQGGFGTHGFNLFTSSVLSTCVQQDFGRVYRSIRVVSGPNASLNSNEYLMVVRGGLHDLNNDGYYEISSNIVEGDYHFMVKNSDGGWSHKPGQTPSAQLGNINPSTYNWKLGNIDNFYDSEPVYFAVEPK